MSPLIYVVVLGWPLVVVGLVFYLGIVRGFTAAVVGGFLFVTPVSVSLADGLPPWDRAAATSVGCLLAVVVLAPGVLRRYRVHWFDLVVVATMVAWGASNIGGSGGLTQSLVDWWWFAMWVAVPYALARVVVADAEAIPTLARGIVAGSLIVAPLVVYELIMSPQLHYQLYGVSIGNATERMRLGGWRPRVFQPAGLGLAIWLAGSAIVAIALVVSSRRWTVLRVPATVAATAAFVLGVFSRGAGAIALMVAGIAAVLVTPSTNLRALVLVVPVAVVVYLGTALVESEIPIRDTALNVGRAIFGDERGDSLATRFDNEAFLVDRALQKPLFGWGGWGDYRGESEAWQTGHGRVLTDGFWVIALGQRGLVGMIGMYLLMLVPGVLAVRAAIAASVATRAFAIVAGLALFTWVYAADLLLNAFPSPVQFVVAGALVSVAVALRPSKPALRRRVSVSGVAATDRASGGVTVGWSSPRGRSAAAGAGTSR